MIILGIDPGTINTGYGLIDYNRNEIISISSGIINLKKINSLPEKLEIIYNELDKIIRKYLPAEFAIETAFYGKNIQSALKIGYAKGVSILSAKHNNLMIAEYSPREIKKALVGTGSASKEQVNYMIKSILNLKKKEIKFDESDALAVAVCHAFRLKSHTQKSKSWKSFVESFPERVIQ